MCSFLIHMSGNRSFRIKTDHAMKTNKINNIVISAVSRNIGESVEPQGTLVTSNWRTKFAWIHNRKCLQGEKTNRMMYQKYISIYTPYLLSEGENPVYTICIHVKGGCFPMYTVCITYGNFNNHMCRIHNMQLQSQSCNDKHS